jgi:hypothetical protein
MECRFSTEHKAHSLSAKQADISFLAWKCLPCFVRMLQPFATDHGYSCKLRMAPAEWHKHLEMASKLIIRHVSPRNLPHKAWHSLHNRITKAWTTALTPSMLVLTLIWETYPPRSKQDRTFSQGSQCRAYANGSSTNKGQTRIWITRLSIAAQQTHGKEDEDSINNAGGGRQGH